MTHQKNKSPHHDHPSKTGNGLTPKKDTLSALKQKFLADLATNGGIVSTALESSGLSRKTAYRHLHDDRSFAEGWYDSLESAYDELYATARARALNGVVSKQVSKDGAETITIKQSEKLLIHLLNHAHVHKKWRERLMDIGRISLQIVRTKGEEIGLDPNQLAALREALLKAYEQVPLI